MRVDSHQHFWKYDAAQYGWITPGSAIHGDFLPPDLAPLLREAGFDRCVAVQARQTIEESKWLLSLAKQYPFIGGVVGWVDLCSDSVEEQLADLARDPKFSGVRHVLQDERNEFILCDEFQRGISRLKQLDLSYDLLVYAPQLPACVQLVRKFPEQRFVLDHLGKPRIRDGAIEPWAGQIKELAKHPNVSCKISGMVTEARHRDWRPDDFQPFLDVVWEAFGEDRLMVGSDWPVCLLSGAYVETMAIATDYLAQFPEETQNKVLGRNAERFYRLPA